MKFTFIILAIAMTVDIYSLAMAPEFKKQISFLKNIKNQFFSWSPLYTKSLILKIYSNNGKTFVKVCDSNLGKKILIKVINSNSDVFFENTILSSINTEFEIDTSSLLPGKYFVIVSNDEECDIADLII